MIIVNIIPLVHDKTIAFMEQNGYKYVKKMAMKLWFELPEGASSDLKAEADKAKALLKADEIGKLYTVTTEVG
ncbi:MAG: hypothetical protein LBI43_02180 [Streptococcaceae bacterium]|jgi:hypothetical protein|nr:hypothetical protein [Streptococcaceae bacterium]